MRPLADVLLSAALWMGTPVPPPGLDPAFAERTERLYALRDAPALARACAGATGDADLLCRYRRFPLTQESALVDRLPERAETARGHALLAGLWGYRASRAPLTRMIQYGRRAEAELRRARALDPHEPFLLLVEGQSLLYRPAVVGGDVRAALGRFEKLRGIVGTRAGSGVSPLEADVWTWFALARLERREAAPLRRRLLEASPPPLYRAFLEHPPR